MRCPRPPQAQRQTQLQMEQHQRYITSLLAAAGGTQLSPDAKPSAALPAERVRTIHSCKPCASAALRHTRVPAHSMRTVWVSPSQARHGWQERAY